MNVDMNGLMQQVKAAAGQLEAMKSQYQQIAQNGQQNWNNMFGANTNYAQQVQQQQQQIQQQMQQQQQSLLQIDPIHKQFISVFSNTKEGAPMADRWQQMFSQWMLKKGHTARLENEYARLRSQFEQENPDAAEIRNKLGVGAIEYAHQLATIISNKDAPKEKEQKGEEQ